MDDRELELDISKKYLIPHNLTYVKLPEGILVIAVDNANWLYLHNQEQEKIFKLLIDLSIEEVLEKMDGLCLNSDDLMSVLTELEAKQFESKKCKEAGIRSLNMYITNKCNLHCQHCYMSAGTQIENELQTNEILTFLEAFQKGGGCNLVLTGGEITERNDLKIIVTKANELKLITTLLTNGIGWSNKLIEEISSMVAEVQVSIDGYDEISNSRIRGPGNFSRALETVSQFNRQGVRVTVAITPEFPVNKEKYIIFGKFLLDTFDNENFNVKFSYELIPGRDYLSTHIDNQVYRNDVEDVVESIYPSNKLEKFALNHKNRFLFSNCGYGAPTISSDGSIYFCNRISELKCYGNIRDMSFEEFTLITERISTLSDVDNLMPCNECDLRYICGGGCRVEYTPSLLQTTLDTKASFVRQKCTEMDKINLYRKMILSNDFFYW